MTQLNRPIRSRRSRLSAHVLVVVLGLAHGLALAAALLPATARADDCTSNLLIVLDRSCSMINKIIDGKSRWQIAKDAINTLMTNNTGKLRFGIGMFPDKNAMKPACVQTVALLPPSANNEANVASALEASTPGSPCVTNIDEGVHQASLEPSLSDTTRRSFVVLITDGAQSGCNGGPATADPKTVQYITDLYNNKVPTYVVGFDVGSDTGAQASLNMFAAAGGLPNSGTNQFYPANSQDELEAALNQLASLTGGEISQCRGMPCPDKRCLSATATCMDGFCVEPTPPDLSTGESLDGGDDGVRTVGSGCSCEVGGASRSGLPALAAVVLFGAFTLRRRRSARSV